jgi:DNA-binding transcriptional LysR family regulator
MNRFDAMSILVAVVDAGSFSAAARRLDIPLATVSRKVTELEKHLQSRLLTRSSRKLALTDAGRQYVAACRRILEEVSEAERAAAGEYTTPRGELVVTAPIVFGRMHLLPVAVEFLKSYPQIDVRIVLTDRTANLLDEDVDLGVRIGVLPDSSLMMSRLGSIRRVACASPQYLAARGIPRTPDQLRQHDCISFESVSSSQSWTFAAGKSETRVPVRSRLVVNTAEAAIDAAIAGLGITHVLSYQIAQAKRAGSLVAVLQQFAPPPWPVNFVYPGARPLPLKLRAFLDFAAPKLKARLAEAGLLRAVSESSAARPDHRARR